MARQKAAAAVEENGRGSVVAPLLEGPGRYVVYETPDGGWLVQRSTGLCETCQGCGCGEPAEPIQIPGMVVAIAMRQSKGNLLGMLKAVSGRG